MLIKKIFIILVFLISLTFLSCSLFDNSLTLNIPKWISYSNPTQLYDDDNDDDNDNARVYLVNAPLSDVYVNLTYNEEGEGIITVPASVIIKKSTTSTTFQIKCLKQVVEGSPVWILLTATAKGYKQAEAEIYIYSD